MGFSIAKLPVVGGMFDNNDDKAKGYLDRNLQLYEGLDTPDLYWQDYDPTMYDYLGDFNPEAAQYQLIDANDPMVYQKQMEALARMEGLSQTGLSELDEIAFNQAQMAAGADARRGRESIMENARARGVAGGGMEMALKQQAEQEAAERARRAGMEQAAEAAKMRALYSQAYGGELANMQNQNYRQEAANKDIINRFNEMNTAARNTAAATNLSNRQAIGNANVDLRNQAQQYNQQGRLDTQQQKYQNELSRLAGLSGQNQQQAQWYANKAAQNAQARKAGGQAIGTAVGGMFGGPAGASMGGSIGGAAGDMF